MSTLFIRFLFIEKMIVVTTSTHIEIAATIKNAGVCINSGMALGKSLFSEDADEWGGDGDAGELLFSLDIGR